MTGRRASRSPRRAPAEQAGSSIPPSDDSSSLEGPRAGRAARAEAPPPLGIGDGDGDGTAARGATHGALSATAAGPPKRAAAGHARRALGARAEDAVVAHLAAQGIEVVARNARVGRLEIDVIARDGPVIAIIEVRTRGAGSYVRALDSIDAGKRARVRRAGEQLWRARFSRVRGVERMRFDAASVTFLPTGEVQIELVKAAF
ncbi:YraN family protein [Sorangium sp. So ce136]|uniref:YraN family protein n=1 Tax=Sorangium sp. So ce136 TaxID=3133284 RepID=UPI003F0DFC34